MEVETPVLQPIYGGALARPFVTHHNALDRDLYLRIATELYLKRCIVGGIDRVYELGKDFRNEGISYKHNPEFTMLEWYEAYADYEDAAERLEQLVAHVAEAVLGTTKVERDGAEVDLAPPWRRVTLRDAIKERTGIDVLEHPTREQLAAAMDSEPSPEEGWGKLVDGLLSKEVEPHLIQPTFILDYPVEMSPFAKRHRTDEGLVERWEAYAGGFEIANAFTELNDPDEQRRRFEQQAEELRRGDEEAQPMDENYVRALEAGNAADRRRRPRDRPPGDAADGSEEPARGGAVSGDAHLTTLLTIAAALLAGPPDGAACPAEAANCKSATGTIIYVERVDPDGDGDAHFVLLDDGSVTAPGITVVDVAAGLRPHPLPGPGRHAERRRAGVPGLVRAAPDRGGRRARGRVARSLRAGRASRSCLDRAGPRMPPDILATRCSRQPEVLIPRQLAAEEVDGATGAVASPEAARTKEDQTHVLKGRGG